MELVAVLFYVINVVLCLATFDAIKREKNIWFVIHSLFFMIMSLLYVIWYYDSSWYLEAFIFTIGGVLFYGIKNNGSLKEPWIIKKPVYLTYFVIGMLLVTIVLRIVF